MKEINYKTSYDGTEFSEFGALIHDEDESGGWDIDEAKLFVKEGLYTYLEANDCSCWDGRYDGWTELTKAELLTLAEQWCNTEYHDSEKNMGVWVLANVFESLVTPSGKEEQ